MQNPNDKIQINLSIFKSLNDLDFFDLFGFGILSFVIGILSLGFLLSGCAKTVTQKVSYGSEMAVEINLRGDVDVINNRYFMVLSTIEPISLPLPPPNNIADEFLSIGDLPQPGSLESYYTNYYSKWSGYIELNTSGYFISKGPFVYGTAATSEILSHLESISSKLTFRFRLSQIFGANVPDTIYFDIISVSYPLAAFKRTRDLIYSPAPSIPKYSGAESSGSDSSDSALNAGQDLTGWKVTIQ